MAASRSTEAGGRPEGGDAGDDRRGSGSGALHAFATLGPAERLAALGAFACIASLVLPWYQLRFAEGLAKSGISSFGFAAAALVLTAGAALVLVLRVGSGRRPPLPLHEGTLLAVAGVWAVLIVAYLMVDRPSATFADFPTTYRLGYGIFVAMGGAVVLTGAGLRIRSEELTRQAATREAVEEDQSPSAPSPSRSRRSPS